MTPEQMWTDPNYRNRISTIAGRITQREATLPEIIEYRAHITLFRMMGEIGEEMAATATSSADKAEAAVKRLTSTGADT